MKSTSRTKSRTKQSGPLEPEFRFNYGEAKPNRLAGRIRKGFVAVLLDPDVARVFKTPESVNAVSRALVTTIPGRRDSTR
jgi:hypothetical protein